MIKEFKLGALDYRVELVDNIDDNGLGRAYSPLGLIKLANRWQGKTILETCKEQTLYHEVVHAMLDELGYHELSSDETFVQSFSLLMHQFDKTKK